MRLRVYDLDIVLGLRIERVTFASDGGTGQGEMSTSEARP